MAVIEMKVPSPGESITEVVIAKWLKKDGDYVEKDEEIAEIDSDKATLTINAEDSGAIKLLAAEGDTVKVGQTICAVDNSIKGESKKAAAEPVAKKEESKAEVKKETVKEAVKSDSYAAGTPSPAAKKILDENKIPASKLNGTGKDGRITKGDALTALAGGFDASSTAGWGEAAIQSV